MSTKENKALMLRVVDLFNQSDESVWELYTPEYVEHYGDRTMTLEEGKRMTNAMKNAFTNGSATLEDIIAEGDKVAYRITWRMTHTGDFMGIPATGKEFKFTYPAFMRIKDGKMAEMWGAGDTLMQQLGAAPK
jgi:predicted ester cyclase